MSLAIIQLMFCCLLHCTWINDNKSLARTVRRARESLSTWCSPFNIQNKSNISQSVELSIQYAHAHTSVQLNSETHFRCILSVWNVIYTINSSTLFIGFFFVCVFVINDRPLRKITQKLLHHHFIALALETERASGFSNTQSVNVFLLICVLWMCLFDIFMCVHLNQ